MTIYVNDDRYALTSEIVRVLGQSMLRVCSPFLIRISRERTLNMSRNTRIISDCICHWSSFH